MKTFLCRWPNGDLSIAAAPNRLGADSLFDEQDNPDTAEVLPVTRPFAIHFTLQNPQPRSDLSSALGFDSLPFNEEFVEELKRVYPILGEVLDRDDATQEMIDQAVEQEKNPISDKLPEASSHAGVAFVQMDMQMPRSLAEALAAADGNFDEDEPDEEADLGELQAGIVSADKPYYKMKASIHFMVAACAQHANTYVGQTFVDSPTGQPGLVTAFVSCPNNLAKELRRRLDSTVNEFMIEHNIDITS